MKMMAAHQKNIAAVVLNHRTTIVVTSFTKPENLVQFPVTQEIMALFVIRYDSSFLLHVFKTTYKGWI
jgi:hypothetical protein